MVKRNSERGIPRKSSENRKLFTGANLVVRPAVGIRKKHSRIVNKFDCVEGVSTHSSNRRV